MALDLGTEPIFDSPSESGGDAAVGKPTGRPDARHPAADPEEHDVAMVSGGEEVTATQAAEGALKKHKWTGMEEMQRKWLTSTAKDIEIGRCAWDLQLLYGQSRALDEGHVARLKASLEKNRQGRQSECACGRTVRTGNPMSSVGSISGVLSRRSVRTGRRNASAFSAGTLMCAPTSSNLRRSGS